MAGLGGSRQDNRQPRHVGDHTSLESRYYLLNRAFPPERLNAITGEHWSIENQLHWMLNVVFNGDQSRNHKDHCPENLALLRKLDLNLARPEPSKGSMRGKPKRADRDNHFLAIIPSQFTKIQMRWPCHISGARPQGSLLPDALAID